MKFILIIILISQSYEKFVVAFSKFKIDIFNSYKKTCF